MSTSMLPKIPAAIAEFIPYLAKSRARPIPEILQPYISYEAKLREIYAQEPNSPILKDPNVNVVPLFVGKHREPIGDGEPPKAPLRILARDLASESVLEKSRFIMPIEAKRRRPFGSAAVVPTLSEFQRNFSIFTENSLSELDWSNVICAGSAVLTSLLPPPKKLQSSKRALRKWYHQTVAPASDVDLFLYGLTEEQALKKILEIEKAIKDSVLAEVTTVRTKNAITICSKYPNRHIQIVLRLYKSVSEVLTGFDVDCSGVAYDGKQVFATPRAITSLVTRINRIDLTRRSPSYESRLAKYARRGFEIHWPELDRTKIDPTIFERSFTKTVGLARLLILEKLPTDGERSEYLDQRRVERGRPERPAAIRYRARQSQKNIKSSHEYEVTDWITSTEFDDVSNYHTLTIPYGELFYAKKIEKMLYTKDLLLNAEWNARESRKSIKLHRHPAFFGDAADVFEDCCGSCPEPTTDEEIKVYAEEHKYYVSGKISFLKDNPGRQAIGSFNPVTDTDWAEMAYVGDTDRLCQAIVDKQLTAVQTCLGSVDPNRRDITGRTPLHLAVMVSSPEIVAALLQKGAHITPRLFNGQNAMHLAASRGDVRIMKLLDDKSKANKALAEQLEKKQAKDTNEGQIIDLSDAESVSSEHSSGGESTVLVSAESCKDMLKSAPDDSEKVGNTIEPKDDILDPNAIAWDTSCSPVHFAIANGNLEALQFLLETHGSDPSFPIKLVNSYNNEPSGAILSLVLAMSCNSPDLHKDRLEQLVITLLDNGAKANQADLDGRTVFEYFVNGGPNAIEALTKHAKIPKTVVNWLTITRNYQNTYTLPLRTAIENGNKDVVARLLELGAVHTLQLKDYIAAAKNSGQPHLLHISSNSDQIRNQFESSINQPIILAVEGDAPEVVRLLVENGADVNTYTSAGNSTKSGTQQYWSSHNMQALNLLEAVQKRRGELAAHVSHAIISPYEKPDALHPDSFYLEGKKNGTYAYWCVEKQLAQAKRSYDSALERYEKSLEVPKVDNGAEKHKAAIQKLAAEFADLEKYLIEKGAKTYEEIHGAFKDSEARTAAANYNAEMAKIQQNNTQRWKPEPLWKYQSVKFETPDASDEETKEGYEELFEAAWVGDFETIKKLGTTPRGENKDQPPLKVATWDSNRNHPFSLALFQGHWDCAMAILELVHAQWMPPKEAKRTYTMEAPSDEDDSDLSVADENEASDDETKIELFSRLPASERNKFTIDNIGEVSKLVNSKIDPFDLLNISIPMERMFDIPGHGDTPVALNHTILSWPVLKNDVNLFSRLLDVVLHYHELSVAEKENGKTEDLPTYNRSRNMLKPHRVLNSHMQHQSRENRTKRYKLPQSLFKYCLYSGLTNFVEVMMRRFGEGIPLDELLSVSGIVIKEKPKYYQGLSIRGAKNTEWANAYNSHHNHSFDSAGNTPPLLEATKLGSLESVKWLLNSETPIGAYEEFARNNAFDERVKSLAALEGGFNKAARDWLGTRRELLIHCAVLSDSNKEKTLPLLKYLLEAHPEMINTKSTITGHTPLHVAFLFHRYEHAKLILEAGGDPTVRDYDGNNLVHMLLKTLKGADAACLDKCGDTTTQAYKRPEWGVAEFLDLLPDIELRRKLFVQKNSYSAGGQTPLGMWLSAVGHEDCWAMKDNHLCNDTDKMDKKKHCCAVTMFRTLLSFSGGEDLNVIEASGDTPTFELTKHARTPMLLEALKVQPSCTVRENAVGRTVEEVAKEKYLGQKFTEAPTLGRGTGYHHQIPEEKRLITARQPLSFSTDRFPSERNRMEDFWKICRAHVAKLGDGLTRQLVTLNEANEVAKRLASNTAKGADVGNEDEEKDQLAKKNKGDEVSIALGARGIHTSSNTLAPRRQLRRYGL